MGLHHKVVGLLGAVLLAAMVGLALFNASAAEKDLLQRADYTTLSIARALERILRRAMQTRDQPTLQATLTDVTQVSDISAAAILKPDGELAFGSLPAGTAARKPPASPGSGSQAEGRGWLADGTYLRLLPSAATHECLQCHRVKVGDTLGFVQVGVDISGTRAQILHARDRIILWGLGTFTLLALITWGVVTLLVQSPLRALMGTMQRIARGDRQARARAGRDEFGLLGARFNEMLEEIERRTQELVNAQAQLDRAQALASIGLLAAGIAHEIAGPLTGITTRADRWREKSPEGAGAQAASAILEDAQHIQQLQQELLTFDRRHPIQLSPYDLVRGIERLLTALPATIQVRREFEANLPHLEADQGLLDRALGNILHNAAEAMPRGGEIFVRLRRRGENAVNLEIEDTGPGIPEENLPRVFEPFFSGKTWGRGLGLAIAREIILRHGGEVSVANRPEGGARFVVRLPVKPATAFSVQR